MINFGSEINTITLIYVAQFSPTPKPTNVNTQKINNLALKIYEMTTGGFLVEDKLERIRFFKQSFLLADTSLEVILKMPFFLLNYVDVNFKTIIERFTWRSYNTVKVQPTTSWI